MRIEMTVHSGNLVAGAVGIDERASARRYVDLLGAALEQKWPDADVDVYLEYAEGQTPPTRAWVGDQNDEDVAFEADYIADMLWQWAADWMVEEKEHGCE